MSAGVEEEGDVGDEEDGGRRSNPAQMVWQERWYIFTRLCFSPSLCFFFFFFFTFLICSSSEFILIFSFSSLIGCLTSPFSLLISFITLCFLSFSRSFSLTFFFSRSSRSRSFALSLVECSLAGRVTSPFSLLPAEVLLLNLLISLLLTLLPDNSLCFFFSSPPPFPFSVCLSLLCFLALDEEGALWRKKSLCLKTLWVFAGGWAPPVAGTMGGLLLFGLAGLKLHKPAVPLP